MKLYDFEYSGNCYKIRLLMGILGLTYDIEPIDLLLGEQKKSAYLAINPKGEVPTLQDGEFLLSDSNAILVYLAGRHAPDWYPTSPTPMANIQFWLSTSANEVQHGLSAARAVKVFGFPRNYDEAVPKANAVLKLLDNHLAVHKWLVSDRATIADIAMYPYTALAEQGEISLTPYENVRAWLRRIEELPGYIPLPVYRKGLTRG